MILMVWFMNHAMFVRSESYGWAQLSHYSPITIHETVLGTCSESIFRESETDMSNERILRIAKICLRVALGSSFLVASADRFGWLGAYGSRNVSWGDWNHFVQYVAILNWFIPKSLIPALAVVE